MIHLNQLFTDSYELKGVDVSSYQGEINWQRLSEQDIDFAFIKATEGSGYSDESFESNLAEALKTKLYIGTYHFFSFDSSGVAQAENFINTVPKTSGMLAPVIDLEFYGDYYKSPKDKDKVIPEVEAMAKALEEYYETEPILYVTCKSYMRYIKNTALEKYPIWIRNVYFKPLNVGNWAFWQYADDSKLEGYSGNEECIDMNVFFGNEDELKQYTLN